MFIVISEKMQNLKTNKKEKHTICEHTTALVKMSMFLHFSFWGVFGISKLLRDDF